MKLYSFAEFASLCNQDIEPEYKRIEKILKSHDLTPVQVMDILMDYARGEDLAEDTINNISKRLIYICQMGSEKTHHQLHEDGWLTFGTIHSDKQRYDLKKIEGIWYAKISMNRGDGAGQELAIELNKEAQVSLNQRLS